MAGPGAGGAAFRGVTFQCMACRSLVRAAQVTLDRERERAGLTCEACGGTNWLPLAGRAAGADGGTVVDVEPGSATALVPTGIVPAGGAAATAAPGAMVPAGALVPAGAMIGGFGDDVRARISGRLARLEPGTDAQRDLAASFERLLTGWASDAEHKALLQKASIVNELAFVGQRYRAVLEEAPGDAHAKKAQSDLLALAVASMSRDKDFGAAPADERSKKVAAAAIIVVALIVCVAIVFYLPRFLGAALDDGTIDVAPVDVVGDEVGGEVGGPTQGGANVAPPRGER